jgi:hypothetical protein
MPRFPPTTRSPARKLPAAHPSARHRQRVARGDDRRRPVRDLDTPCVIVTDGVDTYIVRRGQIHAQTSHAFPVFTCLP